MATKYAGQNALNKLIQLVKTTLNGKLDKTGGTMTGKLTVSGANIDVKSNNANGGNISADGNVSAANGTLTAGVAVSVLNGNNFVNLTCAGSSAAKIAGAGGGYARMAVATPTDDNDATTKAYVDGKVAGLQTADQVQTAINSAISGVYTPKGSIAFASLPTAAAGNKGWVYNVTDAFTTTAAFVEGAGHAYGAGTNVVCVDAGSGSYKWDVLAGTIDLTELTADEVQTLWDSI